MKRFILNCTLYLVRVGMSLIYFFIKRLFPIQKNKVTMLSRQSNKVNIDFEIILDEINKKYKNITVKVLCKEIPNGFIPKLSYCFFIIKCLYHIATSKVCIVDGYMIPISSLSHKKDLIIIQLWHAMGAIKQFGRQILNKNEGTNKQIANIMKMHNNYTYVMCVSQITKKIFAEAFGIEETKILTLGMPRIDYILGKDDKINEKVKELKKTYPILTKRKTILYVPTFRKGKNVHVYDVINAIDKEKYNLIIKLHPLDMEKVDDRYTIGKEYKTVELLKVADYIITDYSAVAFEACILEKPILFYLYDIKEYEQNRGLNIDLKKELPSSTFEKIDSIIDMIENNQYQYYEELKKFKEKYVQTIDIHNTERIVQFIVKLMEE